MSRVENIAIRILANEPLVARSLVQDFLRSSPRFAHEDAPRSLDPLVRAVAAGLVELLAERVGQPAPAWAASVGTLTTPVYLVRAASSSAKLRARMERESPEPLRKRNLFAPAGYLETH